MAFVLVLGCPHAEATISGVCRILAKEFQELPRALYVCSLAGGLWVFSFFLPFLSLSLSKLDSVSGNWSAGLWSGLTVTHQSFGDLLVVPQHHEFEESPLSAPCAAVA